MPPAAKGHDRQFSRGGWPSAASIPHLVCISIWFREAKLHPLSDFPLWGATLIALNKKGKRVRLIAVGCTLCRLAAKCEENRVIPATGAPLALHQLMYGVPLGAEAAVHATCVFLQNLQSGHHTLKLDFRNAFNCFRHDKTIKGCGEAGARIASISSLCIWFTILPFLLQSSCLQSECNRVTHLGHCSSALTYTIRWRNFAVSWMSSIWTTAPLVEPWLHASTGSSTKLQEISNDWWGHHYKLKGRPYYVQSQVSARWTKTKLPCSAHHW